ncbi:MAG: hypothetical protein SGPRY_003410, partial [Prymnesium sp.]
MERTLIDLHLLATDGGIRKVRVTMAACKLEHFFTYVKLALDKGWQPGNDDGRYRVWAYYRPTAQGRRVTSDSRVYNVLAGQCLRDCGVEGTRSSPG